MSLYDSFREEIVTSQDAIATAIAEKIIPPNNTPEFIKANFSRLVEELQLDVYNIYLLDEERAGSAAIRKSLRNRLSQSANTEEAIALVSSMFREFDRFFLSLTQSRRPRAGKAFEVILKTLFKMLNYPFEEQQVINGTPDFLMPHKEYFTRNPIDCIIFTAKRSLRERWRQIVTEGTRGLGFYLATIDEKISSPQLNEILNHRIYLVVPERIKNGLAGYSSAPNVISFESFFLHHLDPALRRWTDNGII